MPRSVLKVPAKSRNSTDNAAPRSSRGLRARGFQSAKARGEARAVRATPTSPAVGSSTSTGDVSAPPSHHERAQERAAPRARSRAGAARPASAGRSSAPTANAITSARVRDAGSRGARARPATGGPSTRVQRSASDSSNRGPRVRASAAAIPAILGQDPRLSKLMSERGICSRREADEWITNGWVRVNGDIMKTLGVRVPTDAQIEVDRVARRYQAERVTILLNKPVGYVSAQAEEGYEPAVTLVRSENRWEEDKTPISFKPAHLRGLAPAGRLDIDSTGLLVLTQDGRIARELIGEDSSVEKEYLVRVEGSLSRAQLALLNHGLELDGAALKPARVSWQNEDQLRFALREGKKRQLRRMCELVGLRVTGLRRVRIGSVVLGKLPSGKWRYLRRDEKF